MRHLIFVIFLILNLVTAHAQQHDAKWLFGYKISQPHPEWGGCVLDFNTEPSTAYGQEREMNLDVTVSSICDSTGNLLFYTNGAWIANHAHGLMENGDSLNPGEITWNSYGSGLRVFQSEIILPYPGHPGQYYLLHLKLDYDDIFILAVNTFYYSLINMNENNGLGKVILKNQEMLTEQTLGTITAVKHANGRDWWVVVSESYSYGYKFFLLSPDGLEFISVQSFGQPFGEPTNGTIAFSSDGIVMGRFEVPLDNVVFYDFDRCTGVLSNPIMISLPETELGGGESFSPNSRFFYMASSDHILQLDLWASDVASSLDTVAVYDGFTDPFGLPTTFFAMQPGADGRIYFNTNNATRFLHVIERPNLKGDSCRVVQRDVQLPTYNQFTSPHFPNYRLGPLDGSPCDTLGLDNHPLAGFRYEVDTVQPLLVEFIDNSFYEPTDWLWDFGDGGTSTEINPLHTFPASGTYTVCLTVSNQYDSDTFCKEVTVELPNEATEAVPSAAISVFPNPASTELNLNLRQPIAGAGNFCLYNLAGQKIKDWKIQPGQLFHTLSLENVPPGMYFWKFTTNGQWIGAGKVVVTD